MSTANRPTSIEQMRATRARFDNSEGRRLGLAYRPSADDVFIATFPKCGTTWTQQILHALRTRGSMDFDEITAVVPWLEMAHALGMDPNAPQVAQPKVFKTHLSYEEVPKGGRYVHVMRDPLDVLVSHYHFHEGWFFEPGSIDLATHARETFLARPVGYWEFLLSWWPHRHDTEVLFLAYEDMLADPPGSVGRLAEHIGCALDPALVDIVVERSSLSFMKRHAAQFDDHLVRQVIDAACGLPEGSDSSKVRSGTAGEGKSRVPAEIVELLEQRWRASIGAKLGFQDYAALREALAAGR